MINVKKINRSDVLGITASGLCAIHCALTPLIFAVKPVLQNTVSGHGHSHGHWWSLFDVLFLILSLVAVYFSSKHTKNKTIKWVLWVAWAIFSLGLLSEFIEFPNGIWLMYIGSFALIITHFINHRFHHKS